MTAPIQKMHRAKREVTPANTHFSPGKKYPAYGRQIDDLRKRGLVPALRIVLTYDWAIGRLYPRIVLDRDVDPMQYRFNFLSGLNLQICIHDDDLPLTDSLIQELAKVYPATIALFHFDSVASGAPAFSLLFQAKQEVAA